MLPSGTAADGSRLANLHGSSPPCGGWRVLSGLVGSPMAGRCRGEVPDQVRSKHLHLVDLVEDDDVTTAVKADEALRCLIGHCVHWAVLISWL